jgi:hypothetical protein
MTGCVRPADDMAHTATRTAPAGSQGVNYGFHCIIITCRDQGPSGQSEPTCMMDELLQPLSDDDLSHGRQPASQPAEEFVAAFSASRAASPSSLSSAAATTKTSVRGPWGTGGRLGRYRNLSVPI